MTLIKLVYHIFSHVWCLGSICQGYIDYKENFRWILILGPLYRTCLIKKQYFSIFNMKYPWRLHRHQCCWNGADKTRTTNRHSHYGELAKKVGQLLFSCCDVRPRSICVVQANRLSPGLTKMAQERLLGRMVRSNYFSDLENCFQTNSSWWWPWWMSSTWPPSKILLFPPASSYLTRLIFLMDTRQYGVYHYSRYR